jgi:excisionase family DNA binding protein
LAILHQLSLPCTPVHCRATASFELHMPATLNNVMTVKEVAEYLRVNQRTVYRLAVHRKMPGFKVGANWRFKRSDIDVWIAEQSGVESEHAAPARAARRAVR